MPGFQLNRVKSASTPTTAYLEKMTHAIMDILCNQKDTNHSALFRKHVADEFKNVHDWPDHAASAGRPSPQQHHKTWQRVLDDMPAFHTDTVDVMADVDQTGSKARTWVWRRDDGPAGGLRKETVSIFFWELRDKVWVCVQQKSMMGVVGF